MSTRNALLALASAALLVAAVAWLLVEDSARSAAVRVDAPPSPSSSSSTSVALDVPQPAVDTPHQLQRTAVQAAGESHKSEYALQVPDYGSALQRPFARAEFELRDARGQPLEGAVLGGAELWRKVGEEWVRHEPELDRAHSRIVCKGAGDSGLAPGEYELEVRAGPYGALRVPVVLARGDSLWRTLEFPNWRRIVRVRFEDSRGQPLKRITQAPEYTYAAVELAAVPRPVVGEPPPVDVDLSPLATANAVGVHPFFHMSRSGWEAYYETDRGMLCARVFAGLKAKLTIAVEAWRWGRGSVVLESDFIGEEWESYPVVLDPMPGLDEQMDSWVHVNAGDPGLNSLMRVAINPVAGSGDPDDLSDLLPGYVRVVVKVSTAMPVRMLSEAGTPRRANPEVLARAPWAADDVWYMDVMRDPELEVCDARFGFTDDQLLFVQAPLIELPRASEQRRIETNFRVEAIPLSLEIVPPGATLAAYAQTVEVSVASGGKKREHLFQVARDPSGSFRARTGVTEDVARALFEQTSLTLRYGAGDGPTFETRHELTSVEREALVANGLRFEDRGDGLAGRVVGVELEGVAGVWFAVVSEDKLDIAEELRRSTVANAEVSAMSAAEAARAIGGLGGENVGQSDHDGYVLADRLRLSLNRRYGLFFFWRSAGRLRDHRIDFMATDGITDLGAVRLP